MSSLKLLVGLSLVAAAVVYAGELVFSKDLRLGKRLDKEKLVCRKEVSISASFMGLITNYRWEYKAPQGLEITRISVTNQIGDEGHGHEARVTLESEGLFRDKGTLLFRSRQYHGIYFTIELYSTSVLDDAPFCLVQFIDDTFHFV